MPIILKTAEEIQKITEAGSVTSKILDALADKIEVGVTTAKINAWTVELMEHYQVASATLGYHGFPASLCTSVNHVVCHGIPNDKPLKNGDIVNLDITVIKDGWYGDSSRMYLVGTPSIAAKRICQAAHDCLYKSIEVAKPGATLGDIGATIMEYAHSKSYSVVREYCGHGIGRHFHEEPQVLHYGSFNQGLRLEEGMTFTIEPMINIGKQFVKVLNDGWTVVTKDRQLSAQWEHTIAIVADGCEILTE